MKIKSKSGFAFVFDFGGVLIDWNPYYLYRNFLGEDPDTTKRFLQAVDFADWNLENDRGRSMKQGTTELGRPLSGISRADPGL